MFLWSANARGAITGHSPGAPALSPALLAAHAPRNGLAFSTDVGAVGSFRLKMTAYHGGWLIAGQSRPATRTPGGCC